MIITPGFQDSFDNAIIERVGAESTGGIPRGLSAGGRRQWLENRQASITRDQWQNFLDVYRPVEEELLRKATQTDFSAEGDEAGQDARAGAAAGRGMLARNLSRLGTRMTPEQAEAVRRRSQLAESKGVAGAENTTRRNLYDSRNNLLAGLVSVGQQAARGASAGFNAAANNAAGQEMALEQGKAAARNTNMAMGASAFMMALMMGV